MCISYNHFHCNFVPTQAILHISLPNIWYIQCVVLSVIHSLCIFTPMLCILVYMLSVENWITKGGGMEMHTDNCISVHTLIWKCRLGRFALKWKLNHFLPHSCIDRRKVVKKILHLIQEWIHGLWSSCFCQNQTPTSPEFMAVKTKDFWG